MCKPEPKCCDKGKDPKECSPEQIAECHPEAKDGHPCEDKADKDEKKCCNTSSTK
jgi:hypothetical protein